MVLMGLSLFVVHEKFPVVQSEDKIRRNMLKKFPVGTEKSTVWIYAKMKNPGKEGAYYNNTGWSRNYEDPEIGISYIRATISDIHLVCIDVIWIFDKNDRLIDIDVWRTIDLL